MDMHAQLIPAGASKHGLHVFQERVQRDAFLRNTVLDRGPTRRTQSPVDDNFGDRCGGADPIKVRVVSEPDTFNQNGRTKDVNQAGWEPQRKAIKSVENLVRDFLNLTLREMLVVVNRDDGLRGLFHNGWADIKLQQVELVELVDQLIHIAPDAGDGNAQQVLTEVR